MFLLSLISCLGQVFEEDISLETFQKAEIEKMGIDIAEVQAELKDGLTAPSTLDNEEKNEKLAQKYLEAIEIFKAESDAGSIINFKEVLVKFIEISKTYNIEISYIGKTAFDKLESFISTLSNNIEEANYKKILCILHEISIENGKKQLLSMAYLKQIDILYDHIVNFSKNYSSRKTIFDSIEGAIEKIKYKDKSISFPKGDDKILDYLANFVKERDEKIYFIHKNTGYFISEELKDKVKELIEKINELESKRKRSKREEIERKVLKDLLIECDKIEKESGFEFGTPVDFGDILAKFNQIANKHGVEVNYGGESYIKQVKSFISKFSYVEDSRNKFDSFIVRLKKHKQYSTIVSLIDIKLTQLENREIDISKFLRTLRDDINREYFTLLPYAKAGITGDVKAIREALERMERGTDYNIKENGKKYSLISEEVKILSKRFDRAIENFSPLGPKSLDDISS